MASFSSSSVAENVCYINGMNVTDPEKGLVCGSVPFDFYKEFQVNSDNLQTDKGVSSFLDFAASSKGSSGNLPNDRRHAFKFMARTT